jgi:capsular polysaccharide biosynthesis protein
LLRKLLEAFFRHKLLLLMPPVLIPGIVSPIAVLSMPPVYETTVSVWIDHPPLLNYNDGSSSWVSGVQNQSSRLSELLRTRAFMSDVASRTSLAPLLNSSAGQTRVADLIARDVIIGGAAGAATPSVTDHLLVIRIQANTAQLSYELCKAIVDAYQEKSAADQTDQASVAVDFYQSQLQTAQQQLAKSTQDLRRYATAVQANNPDAAQASDAQGGLAAAMLDPKLGALQSNVQAAQLDVKNAQANLNQAQQSAMMSAQGQQYGFQVLDAPQLPTAATTQIKKIVIYPIAAAVVGLGLTAMLLVLLVASDRSVRSELDLSSGLRVLGIVPSLQLKRVPKKLRPGATRRAIGAAAGMALPASGGAK